MKVTVVTTTDNTYTVTQATEFVYETGPTGELAVEVEGPRPSGGTGKIAAFGNVEAVYIDGMVTVAAPPAQSRGLL